MPTPNWMTEYRGYQDQALAAARSGDWQQAIAMARKVPRSWDVWQQFPSVAMGPEGDGPGMPDSAIHAVLDRLHPEDRASFLFELASNLPKDIGAEALQRVAEAGKEDAYVTEAVTEHPNFKLSPQQQSLKDASDFWATYETGVKPHHFATVKSLYSGKPETLTDHRGEVASSDAHMHLLPHLKNYAQTLQSAVMREAHEHDHQIRYFNGKPHIKVWRGVGGPYAAAILKAANHDQETNTVDRKVLRIPVSQLTSWSTEPDLARQFARFRATDKEIIEPGTRVGVVMEKWMPVKDILHSGQHTIVPDQQHPHASEHELVFGHEDGHVKVPTSSLHVLKPGADWESETEKPTLRTSLKKGEAANDDIELGPLEEDQLRGWEESAAHRMLGIDPTLIRALNAARFLAGGVGEPDMERCNLALRVFGDLERAALYAYQLSDSEGNRLALKAVLELGGEDLNKAEEHPRHILSVAAANHDGMAAAREVQRGVEANLMWPLALNGKHSKGAMTVRDPKTRYVWLLKPGSGDLSPAAGIKEEKAGQSAREACAWHIADAMGIGQSLPRADLLIINGFEEWAAMRLLGPQFHPLDERNRQVSNYAAHILQPYLDNGLLFKWACFDLIIGQADRHGQNIMANSGGTVVLIDEGSTFAGEGYDPAHDKASFVPYYLRAWAPRDFNKLEPHERLKYMPKLSAQQDAELRTWLEQLDPSAIQEILGRYNINPKPTLARLQFLQESKGSLSEAVCRFFAGA